MTSFLLSRYLLSRSLESLILAYLPTTILNQFLASHLFSVAKILRSWKIHYAAFIENWLIKELFLYTHLTECSVFFFF